jgi:hypothetical protein
MKKIITVCFSLLVCLNVSQAFNFNENVVPLALQSFSAIGTGEKVVITWKAITGTGDMCYTIEKSKDGKSFTKVIDVQSTGTTISYRDYAEADYKPYKGTSYYRLKQIDKKGNYKYSTAVIVTVSFATRKNIKTYSGLLNGDSSLSININKRDSQGIVVVLRDLRGEEFVSKVLLMIEKNVIFLVDEQKTVPPGNYIITSSSDDKIANYRLTVR